MLLIYIDFDIKGCFQLGRLSVYVYIEIIYLVYNYFDNYIKSYFQKKNMIFCVKCQEYIMLNFYIKIVLF